MNDPEISHRFRTATSLASESLKIFVTIVTVLRDSTSIVARLATMRSLTNERSWPILIFAALLPLSQAVLKKILPRKTTHPFWHRKTPHLAVLMCRVLVRGGTWNVSGTTFGECAQVVAPNCHGQCRTTRTLDFRLS
jgi:hypothetical protein